MARSHYEVLGVEEGAEPEVVRRAYLELARRLHPDRWVDASPEQRAEVEERMREVNEAWRVLGNPGRRLAYDAGRRTGRFAGSAGAGGAAAAAARVPFSTGDLVGDGRPPPGVGAWVLRALPWGLLLLALGAIFVFTAYATADRDDAVPCVRTEGPAAVSVPCGAEGAREVVARVADVSACPTGTDPFQPAEEEQALCLRR